MHLLQVCHIKVTVCAGMPELAVIHTKLTMTGRKVSGELQIYLGLVRSGNLYEITDTCLGERD
jgi:hypothetical protein